MASEAGKPLPDFCEDDVTNFLITEAVIEKAAIERAEQQDSARRKTERKSWRQQHKELATPLGVG